MKVEKEGFYLDKSGAITPVFNVGPKDNPWFRAYWFGSYYNVNEEKDNPPGGIWEMVEFVRDLD